MDMDRLTKAGIDVKSALERFMGNEALLERFLKRFPNDPNYGKLKEAIGSCSKDEALTASHTLKGVCGNLSMTTLYNLLSDQVAAMRDGRWDDAAAFMDDITSAYNEAVSAIENQ